MLPHSGLHACCPEINTATQVSVATVVSNEIASVPISREQTLSQKSEIESILQTAPKPILPKQETEQFFHKVLQTLIKNWNYKYNNPEEHSIEDLLDYPNIFVQTLDYFLKLSLPRRERQAVEKTFYELTLEDKKKADNHLYFAKKLLVRVQSYNKYQLDKATTTKFNHVLERLNNLIEYYHYSLIISDRFCFINFNTSLSISEQIISTIKRCKTKEATQRDLKIEQFQRISQLEELQMIEENDRIIQEEQRWKRYKYEEEERYKRYQTKEEYDQFEMDRLTEYYEKHPSKRRK